MTTPALELHLAALTRLLAEIDARKAAREAELVRAFGGSFKGTEAV